MAGRPERALDPSAGPVARFAFELRKLRAEAGSPTYRVMAQRTGQGASTLSQAAGGERLSTLPVVLAYVRACGGDPQEWEERWHQAGAEVAAEPRADDQDAEPPYRGLARFEPADADLFFGRDELTERLFQQACSSRFSAVFGPSGSGKSSLLRAGLIPRLQDPDDGLRPAALRVLTPGEHPMRTHAQRLLPAAGDGDTWLIVDQFEELYTLCTDAVERDEFIDRLLTATAPASRLRVVIAVRADFLGRCAEHPRLTAMLQDGSVLVGPMSRDELREAVVKPAQAGGLIVERSLTARILDEVEGEPGALPLMSHALLETWHRRKGRALTEAAYEAAGGLSGAIARTAEGVYAGMSPAQAELTRAVLLRLVTPGNGTPDTRRPVRREEFDFASAAEIAPVLDNLTRARLLTLDDDTVDLAHEALITAWPRLHGWIDSERSRLRLHRRLTEDAQIWSNLDRDPGALYRGTRLAAAEEAFPEPGGRADFTALERSFLAAGLEAREREQRATLRSARRLRRLLASVSVLAVLAVLAALFGWQQSRAADAERVRTEARRLAAVADTLRLSDPATAMKLSVAAWEIADLPETRSALLAVAAQLPRDAFRVPGPASAPVDLSEDGRTLVTLRNGRAEGWDVRTHYRQSRFRIRAQDNPAFALSPDGKRLAVSTTSGIQLYSTATGLPDGPVLRTSGPAAEVAFGASGRTLLVTARSKCKQTGSLASGGTPLRPARLWDPYRRTVLFDTCPGAAWTDDPNLAEVFQGTSDPRTFVQVNSRSILAVSPDDRLVAVCRPDGGVQVRQVTGRRLRLPGRWEKTSSDHGCPTAAFTSVGHALLLTTDDGLAMWDVASGRATGTFAHEGVRQIDFSTDGRLFATTDDRDVLVWRTDHPTAPVLGVTLPHQSSPGTVRFDRADGVIRYTSGSTATTVWSVSLGHADHSGWHADSTTAASFSPDGTRLATARQAGGTHRLTLLDVPTGHSMVVPLPTAPCPPDPDFAQVNDSGANCGDVLAFAPDNRTFAYSGGGGDTEAATTLAVLDSRAMNRHRVLRLPGSGEDADSVDGLAITPDGHTVLASLSYDHTELWDWRRAVRIDRLPGVAGSLSLSPDGRLLATSEGDVERLPSKRHTSHTLTSDQTTVVAQDPTGSHLAAGDEAGEVTLWDGTAAHRLGDLTAALDPAAEPADANGKGSTAAVSALVFSHDGTILAVGAEDGTVRLWDVTSRKPVGGTLHVNAGAIKALAFSTDGRSLRVASGHVPLVSYELAPSRTVTYLCRQVGAGLSRTEWSAYINGVAYRRSC